MFSSFFRLLRPVRIIKRKGLTSGLFGGDSKWLALGGLVWAAGKVRGLLGFGEPEPMYIEDLKPGQRLVIAHSEPRKRRRSKAKASKAKASRR